LEIWNLTFTFYIVNCIIDVIVDSDYPLDNISKAK
jgi:hypothetical protein